MKIRVKIATVYGKSQDATTPALIANPGLKNCRE